MPAQGKGRRAYYVLINLRYHFSSPWAPFAFATPSVIAFLASFRRPKDDFEKFQIDGAGLLSLTEADLLHKLHLKKVSYMHSEHDEMAVAFVGKGKTSAKREEGGELCYIQARNRKGREGQTSKWFCPENKKRKGHG